ncbi:MAG TPA: hypothetical protein VGA45_08975 [Actinomycetota bacterium]
MRRGPQTVTRSARSPRKRWRPAVLAWTVWALTVLGLFVIGWLDHLLRQAGRADVTLLTSDAVAYVLGSLSAATVGAVLASRRPRHPVGWLLLALGLLVVAAGVATGYARYGLLVRPGTLPGAVYAAAYNSVGLFPIAPCLSFILLLTPTGSLPMGGGWRWWARIAAAAPLLAVVSLAMLPFGPPYQSVANPLAVTALTNPLEATAAVTLVVTGLAILVAAWSLVVRFRRARGLERQRLRWVALAAVLTAIVVLAIVVLMAAGISAPIDWLLGICMVLLPLAIGAAILRYRLYDLDRIISRTVAYGLLTVLLGGGYAGVVLGFGQLLGRNSSLVVAGATLAVAAAFQPARRRVQVAVDRHFNRRRYNAARTIQAFSARLRQEVDLDTLAAELTRVVDRTMEPTTVSLWLRPPV